MLTMIWLVFAKSDELLDETLNKSSQFYMLNSKYMPQQVLGHKNRSLKNQTNLIFKKLRALCHVDSTV